MELLFAERLRKYRRERDLTQEQLAEKIGISPQSVSKWERGDGYPDITHLPNIANFFGITIDTLLGNDRLDEEALWREYAEKTEDPNEDYDPEKRVELALEYYRKYPESKSRDTFAYDICTAIANFMCGELQAKYLPLLREICETTIAESTDQFFREEAVGFMCATCEDEEFRKWHDLCAASYGAYRGEVLEARLWEKGRHDESRLRFDVNNFDIVRHLLFRPNRYYGDVHRAIEWHEFRLGMIESFSEDGKIPTGWLGTYAEITFRMACALFGAGRKEEGYRTLEKAFDLYEEWNAVPEDTVLHLGCHALFGEVKTVKEKYFVRLPDGTNEWTGAAMNFSEKNLMYGAMTAQGGWEWFNPVRDEPRFKEFIERAKRLAENG